MILFFYLLKKELTTLHLCKVDLMTLVSINSYSTLVANWSQKAVSVGRSFSERLKREPSFFPILFRGTGLLLVFAAPHTKLESGAIKIALSF